MKKKIALFLLGISSMVAVSMYAADYTPSQTQNAPYGVPCATVPCNTDTVCNPAPCYPAPCNTDTICNPAPCAPAPATCPGGC